MLSLLTIDQPRKAIGLALAAVVLSTTLVVTPLVEELPLVEEVPLLGDLIAGNASAHTQQECYQQAYVYYPNASGLGRPGERQIGYRTACYNVAHSHFWRNFAYGMLTGTGCAGAGILAGPWTGVGCAMVFTGAGAAAN